MNSLVIDEYTGTPIVAPEEADRGVIEVVVKEWRKQNAARLAKEKEAASLKVVESGMLDWLVSAMLKQHIEAVVVDGKATGVAERILYFAEDREAVSNYILETGALELLQFRLSESAIKERLAEGEAVPGVATGVKFTLFNRKVK